MRTDLQSDVRDAGPHDVLEYESPAAAASTKARLRHRVIECLLVIAICAVLIAILLPPLPGKAKPAARTTNVAHASLYQAALNRHFAEKGTYPAKLEDLAPRYLTALPRPTSGTKWWYRTNNNRTAYHLEWMQYRHLWRYDSATDQVTERQVRGM